MAKRITKRMWVKVLTADEKAAIAARCERLIADKLKPLHLPDVRPSEFNFPIEMFGRWRASKYSFIVRFRSGWPDNLGEEFDAGYARLDHVEESTQELRFHVMWHRHTGQWWRLHAALTLDETLAEVGRMIPPV